MSEEQRPKTGFQIGDVFIPHGLCLAPMAGNTNLAYRRLCRKFGAELTTTEMVSSLALKFGDEKSLGLLERGDDEQPVAAQIFGSQPDALKIAAGEIEKRGFQIVDLNIGCPVPKITGSGGGSALLREPELAQECVASMVAGTSIPVTVKMRCGWDENDQSAPDFAKRMQDAGAQAITVHGRTREQKYRGHSDLNAIERIRKAVEVPVIGNGDVVDMESAQRMLQTGVAGIAIGRGALGRPWLFRDLACWMENQAIPPAPSMLERSELLLELGRGVIALYGEYRGMRIMRRLAPEFLKGQQGAPQMRRLCNQLESYADLQNLAEQAQQLAPR
jgi:tRNA-dihydrouridine synthase B